MSETTQRIDRLIDRLLSHPPEDAEALERRRGDLEEQAVRDRLVDRLVEGEFDEVEASFAGQLLAFIGLGPRRPQLEQLVENPFTDATEQRSRARVGAFAALVMADEREPTDLADELDLTVNEARSLATVVFEATLDAGQFDPAFVETYGDQLLEEPPDQRDVLFEELEQIRLQAGLEAGLLYRRLIEDDTYRELWPRLVDAVADEGNPSDAGWLQTRAEQLDDDDLAGRMRRAAMRLRTEGLDDDRRVDGRGFVGTCDGMGAFPVFLFIDSPQNDGYLGLNLVFRAGSPVIRDGFQLVEIGEMEAGELIAQIEREGMTELAEVPLEVAVGLCQRYLDRDGVDVRELPGELRNVASRVERLPDRREAVPQPEPVDDGYTEAAEILADAPIFESWFFEPGELEDAGVSVPDERDDGAWIEQTARALAGRPERVERVAALCRHMAVWAEYGAVEGLSGQFEALARETERQFESSPVVAVMLERTLAVVGDYEASGGAEVVGMLGDETLREQLQGRHLTDVDAPDVVDDHLDYMELVFRTLESVRPELPASRRPDREAIVELAGRLGRALSDLFCGRTDAPPAATFEHVAQTLESAGLEASELQRLVSTVLTHADILADRRGDAGF